MLDMRATYCKSPKGVHAIATRPAGLTPRQRSLLILVDGQRGCRELVKLAEGMGDPERLLAQLLEKGYILDNVDAVRPAPAAAARTASARSAPPAAEQRPAALAPTELRVPLQRAQAFAIERLSDLLGPAGEDLCLRLRATRSPQEFRASIRRIESELRALVGPVLADHFAHDVENLRA